MKTRHNQTESIMDFYKVKLHLAEANHAKSFAVDSNVNYCLYTALSHLAEVEVLNINIAKYADYQYNTVTEFNPELCSLVSDKIRELDQLIIRGV